MTLLYVELLLLLDERLKCLQIEHLRSGLVIIEGLADVSLLLEQRNQVLDFTDRSGAGGTLGLLLCLLAIECG